MSIQHLLHFGHLKSLHASARILPTPLHSGTVRCGSISPIEVLYLPSVPGEALVSWKTFYLPPGVRCDRQFVYLFLLTLFFSCPVFSLTLRLLLGTAIRFSVAFGNSSPLLIDRSLLFPSVSLSACVPRHALPFKLNSAQLRLAPRPFLTMF